MAKTDPRLTQIVSIKRRAAEAQYRTVSQQLSALDTRISETQDRLHAGYNSGAGGLAADLAASERFTRKLIADLQNLRSQRAPLQMTLEQARLDLQNIICSETVLNENEK